MIYLLLRLLTSLWRRNQSPIEKLKVAGMVAPKLHQLERYILESCIVYLTFNLKIIFMEAFGFFLIYISLRNSHLFAWHIFG